ncbi:rhomboid family intramembrane serine protease [Actinoplanes sp. OR16]|uniref:rhomboid family intramembrane serine protease n=1 Tax=Actinoplanes sp. OR16 TaxID=946334 RepID=UPI001E5735DC|nr:rhomboid family intramembrane serine protease [Actinoplanes sp. OR16]
MNAAPYATYALMASNVAAYLIELIDPSVIDRFDNLGVALLGPDGGYYVDDGKPYLGYEPAGVLNGEWYRLLTSAFLHSLPGQNVFGVLHLVLNLYWMWQLGRTLEERLGVTRYLAVYLLAALGGSVLGVLVDPSQPAMGASGAGFGLAGAYFVLSRRLHERRYERNRLLIMCVLWMVLTAGFTSWEGHLGGLLTGAAAAGIIAVSGRGHPIRQAAALIGLGVVLISLVALKASG